MGNIVRWRGQGAWGRTENAVIEINTPRDVQEAVRSIDVRALERTIEECLDTQRAGSALRTYRLDSCGPFVATKLRAFEAALKVYANAKAAKKRVGRDS